MRWYPQLHTAEVAFRVEGSEIFIKKKKNAKMKLGDFEFYIEMGKKKRNQYFRFYIEMK